jgi:hypothetical protein
MKLAISLAIQTFWAIRGAILNFWPMIGDTIPGTFPWR